MAGDKILSPEDIASKKDIIEINKRCNEHNIKNELMAQKLDNIEKSVNKLVVFNDGLLEKLENKFARKEVEKTVADLIFKIEQRNYDWLKYSIMTAIAILVSVFIKK